MKSVIWKSEAGKQRLKQQYQKFLDKLGPNVQVERVSTRVGTGQALVIGPDDGVPIICLHAMRTGAPFLLSELLPLSESFRLYSPDIPGQPIEGPNTLLPLDDQSNADWLSDVMDAAELESAHVFGVSWGGWIARQMASVFPERVNRLALLVPAGIVNGSHVSNLLKMLPALLRYKISPTPKNLASLLSPIFSTTDDDWAEFTATALADWRFDRRIPPIATDEELRAIQMPTRVIAADSDLSFPGKELLERVADCLPHAETCLLKNCRHCPPTTEEFRHSLANQLKDFYLGGSNATS